MTLDELFARESIRHTIASYNMAGDRLRVDDFVAVFTEDAVFETDGVAEKDAFRNMGRDAIRNWILRWGRGGKDSNPVHQAKFIRHHLSTATSRSQALTRRRPGPIGRHIRISGRTMADTTSTVFGTPAIGG
ncbi:MAG: nuclear transport factor 2 family protein [Rhizomicrobium sp.]